MGECLYTPVDCLLCGANATFSIITDYYTNNLVWKIMNTASNRVAMSSNKEYLKADSVYSESKCLQYSRYQLFIDFADVVNTTNITYTLQIGEHVIYDTERNETTVEDYFTICSSDLDCKDFDGCTVDYCNQTNKL